MSTSALPQPAASPIHRAYDPFAALLSYVIPGLGQIYQGRIGKGLLFMVSLLGMFALGMYLDEWKNVYLPDLTARFGHAGDENSIKLPRWVSAIVNYRLAFAGQFWIGAAAWPAILQYNDKWFVSKEKSEFWHDFQKTPPEDVLNRLQVEPGDSPFRGGKNWDLGWVYTVIAGVLNILVIYDALAGPAFQTAGAPVVAAATPRKEEAVPA